MGFGAQGHAPIMQIVIVACVSEGKGAGYVRGAVKGLEIKLYNWEIVLFTIYPYYGNMT